jgi:hypothetical protein
MALSSAEGDSAGAFEVRCDIMAEAGYGDERGRRGWSNYCKTKEVEAYFPLTGEVDFPLGLFAQRFKPAS